jgi:hypothetical protein
MNSYESDEVVFSYLEVKSCMDDNDIIDLKGIARLLGVSMHTPNQWRQRDLLPEVDFPQLMRPVWRRTTIIAWARSTGRWPPGTSGRPEARKLGKPRRAYRPVRPVRDETTGAPQAMFIAAPFEAAA